MIRTASVGITRTMFVDHAQDVVDDAAEVAADEPDRHAEQARDERCERARR